MKKECFLIALMVTCLLLVQCKQNIESYNGHEYVDLGLSVKWATCNIGADSIEGFGDYFAWGEIIPKRNYNWSRYKYGSNKDQLIKYCVSSDYGKDGFIDDKIVLNPEDDAAVANWGGVWRMPTLEEVQELINNCTWLWTTQKGVVGYLVISNVEGYTDKSIFLPAAGLCSENKLEYIGEFGLYWSSSLDVIDPYCAYNVRFASKFVDRVGLGRHCGRSIRPVCP